MWTVLNCGALAPSGMPICGMAHGFGHRLSAAQLIRGVAPAFRMCTVAVAPSLVEFGHQVPRAEAHNSHICPPPLSPFPLFRATWARSTPGAALRPVGTSSALCHYGVLRPRAFGLTHWGGCQLTLVASSPRPWSKSLPPKNTVSLRTRSSHHQATTRVPPPLDSKHHVHF